MKQKNYNKNKKDILEGTIIKEAKKWKMKKD